jgi:hypothetical protein
VRFLKWQVLQSTIILFVLFGACSLAAELDGFTLMAENEFFQLFVHEETAEVRLFDKRTEVVWSTNPIDWMKRETRVRGRTKNAVGSQLNITYFIVGDEQRTMDSYNDCVLLGQFDSTPMENGVRIDYVLGEQWSLDAYLPIMISVQDMEEHILSKIESQRDRKFVLDLFNKVVVEPRGSRTQVSVYGIDKEKVFGQYTMTSPDKDLSDSERQKLIEFFVAKLLNHRKDLTSRSLITPDDIAPLINNPTYIIKDLSNWDKEDLAALLRGIEIDPEWIQANNAHYRLDTIPPNITVFHIPLEYRLEGDTLLVRIPVSDIQYPKDVVDIRGRYTSPGSRVTLPLHSIEVLPFFGAAGLDEQGYIVVPDGIGALIYLNSGKDTPGYNQALYGRDHSLGPISGTVPFTQQAYMPLMGMVADSKGFLAVIEGGDALAQIKARISSGQSSFNTVAARFVTIPYAVVQLSAQSSTIELQQEERGIWLKEVTVGNAYQPRIFDEDIKLRFSFLYGDEASYSGMANLYREYLFGENRRVNPEKEIPFVLELIGAVHLVRPVLGVPRTITTALTTFDQAQEIVERLTSEGVGRIIVKFSGWLAGGVHHRYPEKPKLDRSLGNEQDFKQLIQTISRHNGAVYPAVSFMHRHGDAWLDGFNPRTDAARFLDRDIAVYYYKVIEALQLVDDKKYHYIVSPAKLDELIESFLVRFREFEAPGLYLQDMGNILNSDFRSGRLIDRGQSKAIIQSQLRKLAESENLALMVSGANAYTLPFATIVLDVPSQSSRSLVIDEEVPLLPMVLSGVVEYAYSPWNYISDMHTVLLKSVETGALPNFCWTYEEPRVVKESDFNYLYASGYEYWFDQAVELYNEIKEVLRHIYGQRIVHHEKIGELAYRAEFENGVSTLVNYGSEAAIYGNIVIPPHGYVLIGGSSDE